MAFSAASSSLLPPKCPKFSPYIPQKSRISNFVPNRITGFAPKQRMVKKPLTVVCAVGDVSSSGTSYLIAGAVAVALVGTAFPILFSRKDLCPECDGAGFIRKSGATLRANAARKDQSQIVCPRCSGLGKLGQIDK
ncbi:uncharacterized protein LOC18436198 [Amborella trichopoda]|uniref:CR-type domain-containing protein n=1 Tax=Amborella trichopoda TaxID=13333 RepID=W1PIX7_AMBTC|nr:uncharacterized protein LOC18436198 [Amborella trichopoda]ERN07958.1 hypothetical protein AMTR_s00012p00250250 [Amborella trichopoda]|eukprot:XP_006846283.1 uncharacterized protein LOC18436198 [Amborella trichopoda]